MLITFALFPLSARADVPETCDNDFWTLMGSRAWQEAQREMTQNSNLIYKPDSVLTYTCFRSYMNHFSLYSQEHFPGISNSGGVIGEINDAITEFMDKIIAWEGFPDPYMTTGHDMNKVLEILILDSLVEGVSALSEFEATGVLFGCERADYLDANFDHTFLGGHSTIGQGTPNSITDNEYACERMQAVWDAAKCTNFSKDEPSGFMPLEEYATGEEFRTLPEACGTASGMSDFCEARIYKSLGIFSDADRWDVPYTWPDAAAVTDNPALDEMNLHLDIMDPSSCGPPRRIKLIVKTGGTDYEDGVCAAPGCWFDPRSGTCNP